jgi:hypothetical protein
MARSWRDIKKIHPAAEIIPAMSPDEFETLVESIREAGKILVPIAIYKNEILDGRHRLDAAEKAGLNNMDGVAWIAPTQVLPMTTDPYAYVLSANLHRRHLSTEGKRNVIAELLKAQPQKNDTQIAEMVKVSPHTVSDVRAEMEGRMQIAHVATHTDTLGRIQPATRAKPRAKPKATQATSQTEPSVDDNANNTKTEAENTESTTTAPITAVAPVTSVVSATGNTANPLLKLTGRIAVRALLSVIDNPLAWPNEAKIEKLRDTLRPTLVELSGALDKAEHA